VLTPPKMDTDGGQQPALAQVKGEKTSSPKHGQRKERGVNSFGVPYQGERDGRISRAQKKPNRFRQQTAKGGKGFRHRVVRGPPPGGEWGPAARNLLGPKGERRHPGLSRVTGGGEKKKSRALRAGGGGGVREGGRNGLRTFSSGGFEPNGGRTTKPSQEASQINNMDYKRIYRLRAREIRRLHHDSPTRKGNRKDDDDD